MSFYGTILNNYPESYEPNLGKVQEIEKSFKSINTRIDDIISNVNTEILNIKEDISDIEKNMAANNNFVMQVFRITLTNETRRVDWTSSDDYTIIPISATLQWVDPNKNPGSFPKVYTQIYHNCQDNHFYIKYEISEEDLNKIGYNTLEVCFYGLREKSKYLSNFFSYTRN